MNKEVKNIAIDADSILYTVSHVPKSKVTLKGKSINSDKNISHKQLKKAFMNVIHEYEKTAQIESIANDYEIGKTIIVISDKSNFRYDIYPEYKANRKGKVYSTQFLKLRKWARKKFAPKLNVEGDDICSYHVRNGSIGFSIDKDLLQGVAGTWYDTYHNEWRYTSENDAYNFYLMQCIAGDSTDNIKGIKGAGLGTAIKLLNKYGYTWSGVLQSYYDKGYTKKDAILTSNLVDMTMLQNDMTIKLKVK